MHAVGTPDVLVMGHLTRDFIRTGATEVTASGGTVLYAGATYARLGFDVTVLTRLAPADEAELSAPLLAAGCRVRNLGSRRTTEFENTLSTDLRSRTQRVRSVADAFEAVSLEFADCPPVHLGPLLGNEMSTELLTRIGARAPMVALDVQGLVRAVRGDRVYPIPWADAATVLPHCTIVKADADEAQVITGHADPERAARALRELGAREALVTFADGGSIVATADTMAFVPAITPARAVDTTGAGDTYAAAYVGARLRGQNPHDAARFATATASLSVETTGPFSGSLRDVEERLRRG